MSTSSNKIVSIYNSRVNLTDILDGNGYNVKDNDIFSINEVDAMYKNNQLDMLLTNPKNKRKIYIKYYLKAKQIKKQDLDEIIEDLYLIEDVLNKYDTLMIITEDEPNDTIISKIKYLYEHDEIFIVVHNIKRLQFNILKHNLVPSCQVLLPEEVIALKQKYNLKSVNQLPEVSRFDPQSLAMCLRPGEVCKYDRKSVTAMNAEYYRVCV
uniref:RNA polymerase subunit H/Rpb5 C-terminal domain-containing protein n=1 Tax=viral metagenome TaxID=1070528 RepID=A0A6C0J5U0_9ZZZZ